MAQEAVSLGFYVSIAGPVTYRSSGPLIDVVRTLPLERLLLETDCPYLPPVPYRGQRNEPAYVAHVAQAIANIRGLSVEQVAQATTANALHLFLCELKLGAPSPGRPDDGPLSQSSH